MMNTGRDLGDVIHEQVELNLTTNSSHVGQAQHILDTKKLEQMTPSQRNFGVEKKTSESYKRQVEQNFEESLQQKYDKIKDIFNIENSEDKAEQPAGVEDGADAALSKEESAQDDTLEV